MPEQNEHWTRNEETVDRYLRGELSGEDRSRLAAHLETCAECKDRIAEEQMLAGAIRKVGRNELKARLKVKIQGRKTQVPWPHVLSAAALLIVVIGVGLYAVWKDRQSIIVTEHEVTVTQPPVEMKKSPQVTNELGKRKEEPSGGGATQGTIDNLSGARQRGEGVLRKNMTHLDEAAAPAPAEAEVQVSRSPSQREFWLEGQIATLLTGGEGPAVKGLERAPKAITLKEDEIHEPARAKSAAQESRMPELKVRQLPYSALPVSMQQQFAPAQGASIPTMVQSTPTGFTLTLYTDQFTLKDQKTRTTLPVPDSLVIEIDGTRILYQLPPALQSDLKTRAAEKQ